MPIQYVTLCDLLITTQMSRIRIKTIQFLKEIVTKQLFSCLNCRCGQRIDLRGRHCVLGTRSNWLSNDATAHFGY